MQTLRDIAPYVALAAVALCAVLLVLLLLLWRSVRRLRRSQLVILGRSEERDIVTHVENLDSQVRNQREAVEILTDQLDEHKRQLDRALTHRAIVRYDAFRDAGGEQSASFALLDQYRSGVVFSAIAARDFARIYVKHLRNGVADRDLSPEERQVVEAAVPRPLKAGERGPRAARAPRPDEPGSPAPAGATATGERPAARAAPAASPRRRGEPLRPAPGRRARPATASALPGGRGRGARGAARRPSPDRPTCSTSSGRPTRTRRRSADPRRPGRDASARPPAPSVGAPSLIALTRTRATSQRSAV